MIRRYLLTATAALASARALVLLAYLLDWIALQRYMKAWDQAFGGDTAEMFGGVR
ncbi:MAG: hypothetical protein JWQ32_2052 [Marmoricola sp.]|nr:hypothetical protein [Marmoricola sp.]